MASNWVCSAHSSCPGPFTVHRTPHDPNRDTDTATCDVHGRAAWRALLRTDRTRLGWTVAASRAYVLANGPHSRTVVAEALIDPEWRDSPQASRKLAASATWRAKRKADRVTAARVRSMDGIVNTPHELATFDALIDNPHS